MSLDMGGIDVGRSVFPLQVKILSQWTPMLSGRTRGWGGKSMVALPASPSPPLPDRGHDVGLDRAVVDKSTIFGSTNTTYLALFSAPSLLQWQKIKFKKNGIHTSSPSVYGPFETIAIY